MLILRIPNWGALQHYKTRSAPWVKQYRRDLMHETPEGAAYLSLSLAARGLLNDLRLLAVETGNATPLYADFLAVRLRTTVPLGSMIAELIANGRLEVAPDAISPAITDASSIDSALSISVALSTSEKTVFSRSSGSQGEGERAADAASTNGNGRRASAMTPIASLMPKAG